ncbi:hypothetical protein Syun_005871 [Stephania yunnanensis]|uniref:Uncharacterized protein n=1 Tax=Stephania yunnanensis TaxID=152371 RepID=A0AAP0KWL0_9MAGN
MVQDLTFSRHEKSRSELKVTRCGRLQSLQGLPILTALQELELGPFSKASDCFPLLLGGDYDDDNGDEVASNSPPPPLPLRLTY